MRAWQRIFVERGITPAYSDEDYFAHVDGKPRYDGVRATLVSRGIHLPEGEPTDPEGTPTVCGLGNTKNVLINRLLEEEGIVAFPGSVELLDHLEARGVAVAVVSSSRNAPTVLAAAGLADRFDVVVDGTVAAAEHLAGKPAPDTFAHAARLLGVPCERAVVVEDALSGVQAGRNGRPDLSDPLDRLRFPVHPWRLTESFFGTDDLGLTESLFAVGNGYIGMRGNLEEGRDWHTHGTYINGFHETWPIRHAESAYGLAEVGQTIVNVPDAKVMRLYVDDEPLLLSVADLISYERTLDLADGVLARELVWRTPGGNRVRVRTRRMVSFTQRHLAVMTYEVTVLDKVAPVVISSQVINREEGFDEYRAVRGNGGNSVRVDPRRAERPADRVLQPVLRWGDDKRAVLAYRCANSGMTLAVAADHVVESEDDCEILTQVEEHVAKQVTVIGRPEVQQAIRWNLF